MTKAEKDRRMAELEEPKRQSHGVISAPVWSLTTRSRFWKLHRRRTKMGLTRQLKRKFARDNRKREMKDLYAHVDRVTA